MQKNILAHQNTTKKDEFSAQNNNESPARFLDAALETIWNRRIEMLALSTEMALRSKLHGAHPADINFPSNCTASI